MSWESHLTAGLSTGISKVSLAILFGKDGQAWATIRPNSGCSWTPDANELLQLKDCKIGEGKTFQGKKFMFLRTIDAFVGFRLQQTSLACLPPTGQYGVLLVGCEGAAVQDLVNGGETLRAYMTTLGYN